MYRSSVTQEEQENILHFTLSDLFPQGYRLAVNLEKGTINLMTVQEGLPQLIMEEELTSTELPLLMALLNMFPSWCPYYYMYAVFNYGKTGEKQLKRALEHLNEAHESGVYEQEIRPLRGATSRLRLKLRPFGIEVASIQKLGYNLLPLEDFPYGTSSTKDRLL